MPTNGSPAATDQGLIGLPLWDQAPPRRLALSDSVPDATAEERAVLRVLDRHRGRANPIVIARLCQEIAAEKNLPEVPTERRVKQVIEGLRLHHRIKIGSRRSKPLGVFLCESSEDIALALHSYTGQLIAMARIVRAFCTRAEAAELAGQLRLALVDNGGQQERRGQLEPEAHARSPKEAA